MKLKIISGIIALIVAFIVVFFVPDTSWVEPVVGIISTGLGYFGITNWRASYDAAFTYFKSKTIWGAIIVVVPLLIVVISPLIGLVLPATVSTALMWLVTGGGALTLYGIFSAIEKKS
jgi:hypothetical protein